MFPVIFLLHMMVKHIMNAKRLQITLGVQRGLRINLMHGDTVMTTAQELQVDYQKPLKEK